MKVLVACEYSGRVREAFRKQGHDAWSCDILDCEDGSEYHIKGDVVPLLEDGWDLMIAHPPCTYLSVSGMHWTTRGIRNPQLTEDDLAFVKTLLSAPIDKICLENPVSIISSRIRKPDCIIQPWMFGEDASKKTCLWLKGLNPLVPTNIIPPKGWGVVRCASDMIECEMCGESYCPDCEEHYADCNCIGPTEDDVTYKKMDGVMFGTREDMKKCTWGNQTPTGQNKLGPSEHRWKERSRTYQGIATAMAEQWG